MEYITVENNIVTELISSDARPRRHWIKCDLEGGIYAGADVRMYNHRTWQLRPLSELVDEHLISLEVAGEHSIYCTGTVLEKVDAERNEIIKKTDYELVKEGARELEQYEYMDDDAHEIKQAESLEELVRVGRISTAERDTLLAEKYRAERDEKLRDVDEIVSNPLRWQSMTDEQRNELAAYRQSLLDVPQQKQFPMAVTWDDLPSVIQ